MANYIISYDKQLDISTLISNLSNLNCNILKTLDSLGVMIIEATDTAFSSVPGILNYELETDIIVTEQWHLNRICSAGLPMRPVYVPINKGLGSTVYLMDSGVDTTHPEFINADIQHLWSWDDNFVDTNGHGTGLASILVGITLGVVPDATLKSVKIPFGQTISTSVLLTAFDAILTDHLLTPDKLKVINCSWNIPKSLVLDTKIVELQSHGLVVVAAAGNSISDANLLSPIGLDTVLGVAASDVYDRVISWNTGVGSNWGPDVDITAPGIDVMVATLDGDVVEKSGTSIAAAVVSGVVCQYIVDSPTVTSSSILQDLIIADASLDMLFRNESIYGTTPNRLIRLPYLELLASPVKENRIINVQKGTTVTVPLILRSPATSMIVHDVLVGTTRRTMPEWASLGENTITISPPVELDTGKYPINILLLNINNEQIGKAHLIVQVFNTSSVELDTLNLYSYHTLDQNDSVVVIQSACGGGCDPYGSESACAGQGKGCGCNSFTCSS